MRFDWAFVLVLPLSAHTISMSHGLARVEGSTLVYELRMPEYELAHISNPEQTLLSEIHFYSGGVEGRSVERTCRNDGAFGAFVCDVVYRFPGIIDKLTVECRLARVTVPNHIHLMRAVKGAYSDQAIFDSSTESAELRFRAPTRFETVIKNAAAGVHRAATTIPGLLFLVALAIAARTGLEFLAVVAAFLGGQAISCAVLPHVSFDPSPQFILIAMVLAIGYLLVEIIFLPDGRNRWVVCGILGIFHGMYYALFLREGEYNAVQVLAGVFTVECFASTLAYVLWSRIVQPGYSKLLAVRRARSAH